MVTVIVERVGTDRFGNPTGPAQHQVEDCAQFPAGSLERNFGQETVEWDVDLFAPFTADIIAADVVILPGDTDRYQVQGKPQKWESPDGWQPGMVVKLRAVSG